MLAVSFTLARVVSAMVGRRACGGRGGEWSKARPQDLPTGLVGRGVWGVVPFEGPGIRPVALVASVPLLLVRVVADATSPRSAVVDCPADGGWHTVWYADAATVVVGQDVVGP